MPTLTGSITQEDIDEATVDRRARIRSLAYCCPFARALGRVTGLRASVGLSSFSISCGKDEYLDGENPPEVAMLIREFDRGLSVSPLAFTVEYSIKKDPF